MLIKSEGLCIRPQDVITVECPNNQGRIQNRFFYIARKGGEDTTMPEYLAVRMRYENNRFSPMLHENTNRPIVCVLKQSFDEGGAKLVGGKCPNPMLGEGAEQLIKKTLTQDPLAQNFLERHRVSDVSIPGNVFGAFLERAVDARRRWEGHTTLHASSSPEGTSAQSTLGDMFPVPENPTDSTFEM